jgi:thioredoxin-dependent peroxiredoxin
MSRANQLLVVLSLGYFSLVGCEKTIAIESDSQTQPLLKTGTTIPKLSGIDQHGIVQNIAAGAQSPLLVYFYPKDGTPGCTKEACAFRDVWQKFEQHQVRLLGVSRDDQRTHEQFANEHNIPFSLIADPDGKWAKAFGVPTKLGKFTRVSFLFDKKGNLFRVYPNVDPGVHANEVLNDVASMPL